MARQLHSWSDVEDRPHIPAAKAYYDVESWPMQVPDRRRHPRVPLRVGVAVSRDGERFLETTRDISQSGVFIATRREMRVGETIELELFLPGGFDIKTRGIVRRVRTVASPSGEPTGAGVELMGLDESERAAIEVLVELSQD